MKSMIHIDLRLRDAQTLALAARAAFDRPVRFVLEADKGQRFLHALFDTELWSGVEEPGGKAQRLAGRHAVVVAWVLRQVADPLANSHAVADAVKTEDRGAAGGGAGESEQQLDGRALAGAIGSQEAEDRVARH